MYDRIEKVRETFTGLARRRYASLARSLNALLAEVTEVAARVENALVVTEDVYLAKVYEAALEHFRVRDGRPRSIAGSPSSGTRIRRFATKPHPPEPSTWTWRSSF